MSTQACDTLVEDLMRRYHADLETMCEIALGLDSGIRVTWHGIRYSIRIDPVVPYGEIWEMR